MDVILLQDVDKLGYKHDLVNVKNGYGRNYLIPKGYAVIANTTNRKKLDVIKAKEAEKEAAKINEYKELAAQLEGKVFKIGAKAGKEGKIFGSVTNLQLMNAIKEEMSIEIERRKIELRDDIKTLGSYKADVKLHPEVTAEVGIEVIED